MRKGWGKEAAGFADEKHRGGVTMMPGHTFRGAVFQDQSGRRFRLQRAVSDLEGSSRRPFRIHLVEANGSIVVELSRKEAYAFSEWLDEAVTQEPSPKPQRSRSR